MLAFAVLNCMAQDKDSTNVETPDTLEVLYGSGIEVEPMDLNLNVEEVQVQIDSKDTEVEKLKATIKFLETQLENQNKYLAFADSLKLRISNDCFRFKYDKERVDEAVVYFNQMYSDKLRQSFAPMNELLRGYGMWYAEIKSILNSAQQDYSINTKKWKSAGMFGGMEYKPNQKFIKEIKSSYYYSKYYKNNWTIFYLDDLITKAIDRLNQYNEKNDTPLDFTDILK